MTYYLLNHLQKTKIRATVIEPDKQRCRELAEKFDCNVIREDGTNQSVLKEEGIAKTDAFLALSSQDEENAIVSLYAKSQNTKKIITLINAMQYVELFKGMGLDGIVSPKYSTSNEILRYVRSLAVTKDIEIESLHKLMEDNFEALECVIKEPIEGITGIPLKNLKLRRDVLLASIIHKDKVIIPSGNDKMESGDTVILFTSGVEINDIKDILK
jgi:trk system potassium uptake protein TrkA